MNKFKFIVAFFLISFYLPLQAQYEIEISKSLPIGLIGVNSMVTAMILKQNKTILTADEINNLSSLQINSFDRNAVLNYSTNAQKWSDYIATSALLLPIITLSNETLRNNWKTNGLLVLESYLLTAGLTNLTKELVKRKRPFVYNPDVPLSLKLKADASSSFFSGHTSMTATSSFLTGYMLQSQASNTETKVMIWVCSASIPALVGYLRWKGGKHFLSDILVGYAIGATIGILVPKIHETNN